MANPFGEEVDELNPFDTVLSPVATDVEPNPFDISPATQPIASPMERALQKTEYIGARPGFMDRLTGSVKRKLAIFQKAGLEGLTLNNVTLNDLPIWAEADVDSF